jgi:hypothetical protein
MSNENTNAATDTAPVSHYEAKRIELVEDIAAAQAKVDKLIASLAKLDAGQANAAAIEALTAGDSVAYVFGRGDKRRVLNGIVRATNKNDKGVLQLKVETGEGFDAEFNLIDSAALLLSAEEVEAAQQEIEKAKADAAEKAKGGES